MFNYENVEGNKNYTVYMHIFPNNKKYIGITSRDVSMRWMNGKGYKSSNFVRKAIDKYGWANVKHEILFSNLTKEQAEQKEVELIAFYKTNNKSFGYNIQNGGNSKGKLSDAEKENIRQRVKGNTIWLGKHHSEETKEKLRKIHTGMKMPKESIQKRVEKIKGRKLSESHRLALLNANIGKPCSKEKAKKISLSQTDNKQVLQIFGNKIINEFYCMAEAQRHTGVDKSSISRCCRGLQFMAGGFEWKYKNEEKYNPRHKNIKHILQLDKDKNILREYKSITDVCSENKNFTETPIRRNCRGESKYAYGYIWRYK